MTPIPSFAAALRAGNNGGSPIAPDHTPLTVHRLLNYPFVGFVPYFIGIAGAHVIQVLIHLANGALLYLLVIRLGWRESAAGWASALFMAAPWISQAVIWWSASPVCISTTGALLASHAFITSRRQVARNSWVWLTIAMAIVFVSLLFYELWLAGIFLFAALEWCLYSAARRAGRPPSARSSLCCVALMAVPYIAWSILFKLTYADTFHKPLLSPERILLTCVSAHARVLNWFSTTPWTTLWTAGLEHWTTGGGGAFLIASLCGLWLLWRESQLYLPRDPVEENQIGMPFVDAFILAWGMFAASRLVFVLQGGVSLLTRHAYGGTAGLSIAIVALMATISWLARVRNLQGQAALAAIVVLVMAAASAGRVALFAKTSSAEQKTIAALRKGWPTREKAHLIIAVPTGALFRGELGYFAERNGLWLEQIFNNKSPTRSLYVVDGSAISPNAVQITDIERNRKQRHSLNLPRGSADVFFTRDGTLSQSADH